jgi:pyrroline-5-carboxylate reductase
MHFTIFWCLFINLGVFSLAKAGIMDIRDKCLGFVGTGKISSCLVRGFATAPHTGKPRRIVISPRNEEKAKALKSEFPELVEIASDNAAVVEAADIVFVGLLPGVARDVLPTLPFTSGSKLVISMMAAVDMAEVLILTGLSQSNVVRTVPLPSAARREGPIVMHPQSPLFESLLSIVGTPVPCSTEAEMKPLVCLTGHISSFFELMRTTQAFMETEGVSADTSRLYVSSFYSSLAHAAELSNEYFEDMAIEARTPGGINEQCMRIMQTSEHFHTQTETLSAILRRLRGQEVYVPLSASTTAPTQQSPQPPQPPSSPSSPPATAATAAQE